MMLVKVLFKLCNAIVGPVSLHSFIQPSFSDVRCVPWYGGCRDDSDESERSRTVTRPVVKVCVQG